MPLGNGIGNLMQNRTGKCYWKMRLDIAIRKCHWKMPLELPLEISIGQ
jgi:hypothetical protein